MSNGLSFIRKDTQGKKPMWTLSHRRERQLQAKGTRSSQKQKLEVRKYSPPETLEEACPHHHLDFGLLASRTERMHF